MDPIERRDFLKGTATGVFAFTVGGVAVLLSPRYARAQNVPFRLLKADEAQTIEALGEALVPGARAAGIAHFVDQQLSVPPEEALLEARILNVRPPYANFYRAAMSCNWHGTNHVLVASKVRFRSVELASGNPPRRTSAIGGYC